MNESIAGLIRAHLGDADVEVDSDGSHFEVRVTSAAFAGLSRVRRQQLVYEAIGELIREGTVHAVTIRASTPDEVPGTSSASSRQAPG